MYYVCHSNKSNSRESWAMSLLPKGWKYVHDGDVVIANDEYGNPHVYTDGPDQNVDAHIRRVLGEEYHTGPPSVSAKGFYKIQRSASQNKINKLVSMIAVENVVYFWKGMSPKLIQSLFESSLDNKALREKLCDSVLYETQRSKIDHKVWVSALYVLMALPESSQETCFEEVKVKVWPLLFKTLQERLDQYMFQKNGALEQAYKGNGFTF